MKESIKHISKWLNLVRQKFPLATFTHSFIDFIDTHTVKVYPEEIFENLQYIEIEEQFCDSFSEKFPNEDLVFELDEDFESKIFGERFEILSSMKALIDDMEKYRPTTHTLESYFYSIEDFVDLEDYTQALGIENYKQVHYIDYERDINLQESSSEYDKVKSTLQFSPRNTPVKSMLVYKDIENLANAA